MAVMGLSCWTRRGGRNFVSYHSHPGFKWDDQDVKHGLPEDHLQGLLGKSGLSSPF